MVDKRKSVLHSSLHAGIKWPFLFSVAMLVFALLPFAALSSILADQQYTTFEPSVPKGEFWRLQDLYLWHFMSSVPSLKITETLLLEEPFRYKDHLSGVLLLAFKIFVTPLSPHSLSGIGFIRKTFALSISGRRPRNSLMGHRTKPLSPNSALAA
jgi:hypothetical protein